jgi:ATP-binding cassette subfamily G (WHITE) protein 2 (SNQ2)
VIDEGRQIFFGPVAEARQYFLSLGFRDLPRQTTADYLTGCTDPNERQYADGRSANDVPSTPEHLEQAFRESKYWKIMEQARAALHEEHQDPAVRDGFVAAVKDTKGRFVSRKSPYTASFFTQVRACECRPLVC